MDLDTLCVNTIRMLSADAVEKAKSGHPGAPMGLAPAGYLLFSRHLKHNPRNPDWPDRDRFLLSAGHASALLYSLLHLSGYDLSLDDLKSFRQWGSRTPGHPEARRETPGVEATTGPLGQGFANGVGMALAERLLAKRFNRPGHTVVDHRVYALVSDGDLMEGVAAEAASLAGHLQLGKLVYVYDDNRITIDGTTDLSFSREDVARRFEAYGWQVQTVEEGHDLEALGAAVRAAEEEETRPSLVVARTHIAHGSPNKQDTSGSHGSPLGEKELRLTKEALGLPGDAFFLVPDEVYERFAEVRGRGEELEAEWRERLRRYREEHPDLAAELERVLAGDLPGGWEKELPDFGPGEAPMATRSASGKVLNALAPTLPELVGGSADLTPSNNTELKGEAWVTPGGAGRNIHFGVREHAMGALLNGMSLHGGFLPYGGTFLIFSDYMRPAIRVAALTGLQVIYVFTHDSVGVGEDGPTHQPVEQIASLRAMPNLWVIRPADAAETAAAWRVALERRDGPTVLALSRQKLPALRSGIPPAEGALRGGYVVAREPGSDPLDLVLLATGSEVSLAVRARQILEKGGARARVVSLPCLELFEAQDPAYRDKVLPPGVQRLVVEAGSPFGWERWVGEREAVMGIERFGASAPGAVIFENLGFTAEAVAAWARERLGR